VPFRLLIIHATAAHSNDVTIDRRRNDVDYERFGLDVLIHRYDDISWDCSDIWNDPFTVSPSTISFNGLIQAYKDRVEMELQYDDVTKFYTRWGEGDWTVAYDTFYFASLKLFEIPWTLSLMSAIIDANDEE
jgi:hypothetical protein